jgi:hypothetical protein
MNAELRAHFNRQFTPEKYHRFLADLNSTYGHDIAFRVAESPIFIGRELGGRLRKASEEIIDTLVSPNFGADMEPGIPPTMRVPNETPHTLFLCIDFAICRDEQGELMPQLIELQGVPSLFGYQDFLGNKFREHYDIPSGWDFHFGQSSAQYWEQLREVIIADEDPENVILLEIDPMKQNTAIDFLVTKERLGIEPVHIGEIRIRNRKLYYSKEGREIPVHRLYNRVIFDEMIARRDLVSDFRIVNDVDVQWAGHPNWFFKISKYTMPFLNSSAVPECKLLSEFGEWPQDLDNYVLKPLYSFSGTGVIFHLTRADIEAIPLAERKNFLLQKKVKYEPFIQAPDGLVKAEIRLLFLWEKDKPRPELVTNLVRMSRGDMIGVKYNKDKTWVGGTVGFFEQ